MAELKQHLKDAKSCLQDQDYEDAIYYSKEALKVDPTNYFAHMFMGKAYMEKGDADLAIKTFEAAIDIDKMNMLGWKGLFALVKSRSDFAKFFVVAGDYSDALIEARLPLTDILKDIRAYINLHSPKIKESYLRALQPGTQLSENFGASLKKPQDALRELLDLEVIQERDEVGKLRSRERMKMSSAAVEKQVNSVTWSVYKDSPVAGHYKQLINMTDDDEQRRKLEDDLLKYNHKVCISAPADLKPALFGELKEMVEDMVVVKHDSFFAWNMYLDWMDVKDIISDFDLTVISQYISKFNGTPLANILLAYILSDVSSYDSNKFQMDTFGEIMPSLSEQEILIMFTDNIAQCKTSILAHRIVGEFFITLKEYETALQYVRRGIKLLLDTTRELSASLKNTHEELTVDYGTIDTYFEAPKNHDTALQLFDKVLSTSNNTRARIGKGLIMIQRENWAEACEMLTHVVQDFPENYSALSELSWCHIKLGEAEEGRKGLQKVLDESSGTDVYSLEFRALNFWRLAESYDEPEKAFKYLIESVKVSDMYAPSYTSLGKIYQHHYGDTTRALRCFFKAFEIDNGQEVAARYLVEAYTAQANWEQAATIAQMVTKNSKINWPYRILGIAHLEKQQETESIEYFQSAIRIDTTDVESWVGLGQAYAACGRLEASIKVFKRALELEPDHEHAKYFLAISLSQIGEYEDSIDILNALGTEEHVVVSLGEVNLEYALSLYNRGFYGKSIKFATQSIELMAHVENDKSQRRWNVIIRGLRLFLLVQSRLDEIPLEALINIFEDHDIADGDDNTTITCKFLILAARSALAEEGPRTVQAASWYNLGLAQLLAHHQIGGYAQEAIVSFKRSIQLQSNTAETWVALGIASFDVNARVSQHCLIKALALSPKDIDIWTSLALLALRHDDPELARDIFKRAQSIAPQESKPWLGYALTDEKLNGDASHLFRHAFVLANGKNALAQLLYGSNVIKHMSEDERDVEAVQELTSAGYGLLQYMKQYPDNDFAIQIALVVLERLHDYQLASELSNKLAAILETRFSKTQNDQELLNFGLVKSQFARIQLGMCSFETAVENATMALGILPESELEAVISNHVVLGLAHFFQDNFDEALEHFKHLLTVSGESQRLVVLIAQVLYVYDTQETKDIALQELVDYIANNGPSLLVTMVIAAISLLESSDDDLLAIKKELHDLPLDQLIKDTHKDIPYLINQINKRLGKTPQWQRTAFFFPNDFNSWTNLDQKMAHGVGDGGQNKLSAQQLASSYLSLQGKENIQRSIFLAPWNAKGYIALKETI